VTLVSIITPSYNQAAYLEQAMHSVLLQDTTELEYCVVDGGSADGSREIIERYASQLSWWVSEKDRGQADAINKGLQHTHGEIIAWLNSDDLYLPGAIQQAASVLNAHPELGFVFGDAITIDADGRPLNRLSFSDWNLHELSGFRIICQPAVFMRRAVLERAGYLDPTYHFMLDHHLWIRLARLAPIRHIPHTLAAARQHPAAKNVNQAAGFSQEIQRLLDWMLTQSGPQKASRQECNFIIGGASRLQARYYLDGDQPARALRFYARALRYTPEYALKHWHRILYAAFCLLGLKKLADRTLRPVSAGRKSLSVASLADEIPGLADWPGLLLENNL
jgi:glycosyltransferase involved in cell wall biosynthesis